VSTVEHDSPDTSDDAAATASSVDDDDGAVATPRRGRALAAMAVVGLILAALVAVVVTRDDTGTGDPVSVEVPAGAGDTMYTDGAQEVVPAVIRLRPGQQLVLTNDDWRPHTLGPLTADRGATVRTVYDTEGRYFAATSLRLDGRVTILVEDPTR
jgi:hypothetical protein